MIHAAINQVLLRAESAKSESDFTYFFTLLLLGEVLAKITTLGIVAAIGDNKDRNRYRLEYNIVRSDGLGDWGKALEDALTGTASQYLKVEARNEQAELTKLVGPENWQYQAVAKLKETLMGLGIDSEEVPTKTDMKRWFRLFATLRNKTRAHGAITPGKAGAVANSLAASISLFYTHHSLFRRPWAHLYRNLSGKYRVTPIAGDPSPFDFLKKRSDIIFNNGIYIMYDIPIIVNLISSDPELQDFYFANGGFSSRKYEMISYRTDNKMSGDASLYQTPAGSLPPSDTEGSPELYIREQCLSNAPNAPADLIARPQLEDQLSGLLLDEKRTVITLVGRGGVGKTSLALSVLPGIYKESKFRLVIWFSGRDVDLRLSGPKPVRQGVMSSQDVAAYYSNFVASNSILKDKGFDAKSYFEGQLRACDGGPCLFIFDNFETMQNPMEMYTWLDTFIYPPNKILITTRLRDFKGDYPIDVPGMEEPEARLLITQTAAKLGITEKMTGEYVDQLVRESDGHPYVIKILLGEVAKVGRVGNIQRVVAASDDVLTALFERTYAALSPCAQRSFLTLAAWNSSVPRVALEAVLIKSIGERSEVEKGIESLLQFSIGEVAVSASDGQENIGLPLVAEVFGKKKLNVSPYRIAIQADVEILQMLGPGRLNDLNLGLQSKLERFIKNISRKIESGDDLLVYLPIIEMICRRHPPGWLLLARLYMEAGPAQNYQSAKDILRRYLEIAPTGELAANAWRNLAYACYVTGDTLGEIHAFIERSRIASVPFAELSNTASRSNQLLAQGSLEVVRDEKRQLASRIAEVLEKRKSEADADDFSRMAWLALNLGNENSACEYVQSGLALDEGNYHCQNLAERLNLNS
ncbi:MAG TPA: NB-ARC domain-containing protein [Magnetospirillaceae bacterium]|jgi:hypothetical protein